VIADVKAPAKTLSATLNLGGKLRQPELRK